MTALLRAFMLGLLIGIVIKLLRTTPMPPRNASVMPVIIDSGIRKQKQIA